MTRDASVTIAQADAPRIRKAGAKPATPRRTFVNMPVDVTVQKAVAAGGARIGNGLDLGFMYSAGVYDVDGYHWDVFWMDPSMIQG